MSLSLNLLASLLGLIGTVVLFKFSYALESDNESSFGDGDPEIDARNQKRVKGQRIGLGFLCASFFCSGLATVLSAV